MADIASFLIADGEDGASERLQQRLQAFGVRAEFVQDVMAVLAARSVAVDAVVLPINWPDLEARLPIVRASGIPILLAVAAGPASVDDLERALVLGCAGVLPADVSDAAVAASIARLRERFGESARDPAELQRLRIQSDELRRRCAQQAERFQESQETFYLDLSRMMNIITNIMDGIVFVDRGGNVTLMNPAAEDLLGIKSFVAIGRPLAGLQGCPELVRTLAGDHERIGSQKEIVQTVEVHHSEQDLLYIKCMTSRVLDYRAQPAGTLTVLRDVTAEFKTDQLKNQYLSIVAHELRTPLTGIKTFATMMVKGTLGSLSERQQRVCESIREQSVRLEHQIDKLINLGNLESADYGQDREVVPLWEFAAGLLAPFEQPARDRRIDLSFEIAQGEAFLFADRADLRRACQALIENSVKFARDGGRVAVSIERDGDGLRFRVHDDGIGIDPRYHRRVFEKFFQVEDPLTRHHGGAGLGLFVARGIVEAHGSRIELSSQLGQGADFSFALPVHRQIPQAVSNTP
jgi:two-component system, OmpR family, phosphate regulon sensor histidine kinase PhoR